MFALAQNGTRDDGRAGWFLPAFLLVGIMALVGCATTPPSAPMDLSSADWTIRQGQAVWKPKPDEAGIAGELMVAMSQDGRSVVQFSKTPLPIAAAEIGTNSWRVTFADGRRNDAGRGAPPDRVLWLQFPAGLVGRHSSTNWYFARTQDDGWHFENLNTEEALDGFLTTIRLPRLHVVKEGETINKIARLYGVTTRALREANPGATGEMIHPGNIIALPELSPAPRP